jgi:two-component system sensor histidine kinase AtoS
MVSSAAVRDPPNDGKVFKPFFTTKESGTGLGLSMTRKILDLHDGWITAESGSGGGATFTVFLPKVRS